jgi:hypothetical protein
MMNKAESNCRWFEGLHLNVLGLRIIMKTLLTIVFVEVNFGTGNLTNNPYAALPPDQTCSIQPFEFSYFPSLPPINRKLRRCQLMHELLNE